MIKGKVVVQILVYSEPLDLLDRLFSSLEKVDYPKDLWEIVVVNNHCPGHEGIAERITSHWVPRSGTSSPQIRFFPQQPNLGFAGGHARAAEEASALDPEFLYLLNSDALVDPGFIREAVAYADAHPMAGLVQSRIMLEQEPELLNASGNAMHYLGFGFSLGYRAKPNAEGLPEGETRPTFYPSGAGVLVRVAPLKAIGGLFDPAYFLYHEDSDLGWRMLLTGHDVAYAPKSVIFHRYEFSKSTMKFYWIERNRNANLLIFYRLRTLLLIALPWLAMEFGTMFFAVRAGWWKEKLRASAFYLRPSTWRWIGERRRLVQRIRTKKDRDMLAYMVGDITNQDVENPLLSKVVNPLMRGYFSMLRAVVRW